MTDEAFFLSRRPKGTWGDFITAVLAIRAADEARRFFLGYVTWLTKQERTERRSPEEIARANIGWCFGEGMHPRRIAMWVRASGATHPIFGARIPTPKQAFQMGMQWGRKRRQEAREG